MQSVGFFEHVVLRLSNRVRLRYPVDEPFLNNVRNEVIYQVKRLQSHPSIVLWAGNNENEAAVAQNWYQVPPEEMNKTRNDYRKLYIDTVMQAVLAVDKGTNRPFVSSSPSNGIDTIRQNYIATDPQDPLRGKTSLRKRRVCIQARPCSCR